MIGQGSEFRKFPAGCSDIRQIETHVKITADAHLRILRFPAFQPYIPDLRKGADTGIMRVNMKTVFESIYEIPSVFRDTYPVDSLLIRRGLMVIYSR